MTISSAVRVAGPYTGNGTTTSFPFAFKVFTTADIKVIRTDLSAVESTLNLGTDYSVTLNSNQNVSPGGTVIMSAAPASGYLLTLTSQVANLQSTDLTNEGGFYPSVITNALDKLTVLVQQLAVQVGLSVRVNISSGIDPATLITTLITSSANAVLAATQSFSNAAAALASQVAAAASAVAAAASATSASTSAAAASAVVLSNEPVRPTIRPSLLLDFANTEVLDPRITFSRPTTATYYDNHTTATAEQNLLTYSQDYTQSSWTKGNVTNTANTTTAPDGTTTASTLTTSAGSNFHDANNYTSTLNSTYTASVYLKAGTSNFASLGAFNSTTGWCYATINLSTGSVTQTGGTAVYAYVNSSISALTGSWYKVSLTFTISASTTTYFTVSLNSSATPTVGNYGLETWTALGTETIYIWGAQLEQRSSATAYNATTTTAITNYIPVLQTAASNQARFDHNPTTGESLGLQIEEQRTNLLTYSSDYTNAAWTKTASSITATANIAPDGTQTASKLFENTATSGHSLDIAITVTSGISYTQSMFAKAGERPRLVMYEYSSTGATATFDMTTGTVVGTSGGGTPSATITSVGNGWYRCTMSWTTGSTSAGISYRIQTAGASGATSYTGNGFSGIYIWGAQLEAGSFATSYIPTVASQVTRSADSASMTGSNFSSWYNQSQGTVYTEAQYLSSSSITPNGRHIWFISDGTGNNFVDVYNRGGFQSGAYTIVNGAQQASIQSGSASSAFGKTVFTIQPSSGYLYTNGSIVGTQQTAPLIPSVNQINIGNSLNQSASYLNGYIKKLAYYPQAISSAQLQGLTTV